MRLKPRIFRKPQLTHPLARGLVGYWLHNEGSGLITNDLSGHGNYGAITGATWVGDGLSFDATDVVTANDSLIALPTGFTIIVEYKVGDVSTRRSLAEQGLDTTTGFMLEVSPGSVPTFWTGFSNITGGSSPVGMRTTIAGVWDGAALLSTIYQDGVFKNSGADTLTAAVTDDLLIGKAVWAAGSEVHHFNGIIYDVKIYNRALSAGEILRLYRDPYILFRQDPAWMGQAAVVVGANPKGPLTHPLYGPFAGPIAC